MDSKVHFLLNPSPWNLQNTNTILIPEQYDLLGDFKLNIEVNHATLAHHTFQQELQVVADAGVPGIIDANTGDYQNGWDTDQFPNNLYDLTKALFVILEAGGLNSGGVNFDAKTRRTSTDLADIFYAHIGGMDAFARSLLIAQSIIDHVEYNKLRNERYSSFDSGDGKKFSEGKVGLADLAALAAKNGEPKQISGKQEYFENLINRFI